MTAPIKTCNYCRAVGVMPTFMNGETVCYDCLQTLPKTLLEAWREIASLRAKIEQMERQEPVAKVRVHQTGGNAGLAWSVAPLNDFDSLPLMRDGSKLYTLPGAKAQNTPKAVAYLDLGVGGYMDIGTDLTDEELATLPKGRHMLAVIGTYGVDGYVPAQPAPSMPEVTDAMALAFHHALTDGSIGAREVEEIKDALRAALAAAPKLEGE